MPPLTPTDTLQSSFTRLSTGEEACSPPPTPHTNRYPADNSATDGPAASTDAQYAHHGGYDLRFRPIYPPLPPLPPKPPCNRSGTKTKKRSKKAMAKVVAGSALRATGLSRVPAPGDDKWVEQSSRQVPALQQGTLEAITVLVAGFQRVDKWEKWIAAFTDSARVSYDGLFESDSIVNAAVRCHRGEYAIRVQAFRNIIFQMQLAAKVAE